MRKLECAQLGRERLSWDANPAWLPPKPKLLTASSDRLGQRGRWQQVTVSFLLCRGSQRWGQPLPEAVNSLTLEVCKIKLDPTGQEG